MIATGFSAILCASAAAGGVGTAFIYQGELRQSGDVVNGSADFEFTLWSAAENGLQIGNTISFNGLQIEDGKVVADLDFGLNAFDGNGRWLEIAVSLSAESAIFQVLQPRQPVTPAPYALYALSGNEGPPGPQGEVGPQGDAGTPGDSHWQINGSTTYYEAGNVGIGTPTPFAQLTVSQDDPNSLTFASNYDGPSGNAGLFGCSNVNNAETGLSIIHAGTGKGFLSYQYGTGVAGRFQIDNPASDAAVLQAVTNGTGPAAFFGGDVGIGTQNPSKKLSVSGGGLSVNDDVGEGITLATDSWNLTEGTSEDPVYSYTSATDTHRFYTDGATRMTIAANGNVGIGTTDPSQPLDVNGDVLVGAGSAGFDGNAEIVLIRGQSTSWALGAQNEATVNATGFFIGTSATDEATFHITQAGNVGIGTSTPLAKQHIRNGSAGVTSAALESDDLIVESADAVLGLYSNGAGGFGSAIALKEISGGNLVDTWGIVRMTNGAEADLRFTYGTSDQHWANPTRVVFESNGEVGIGTTDPEAALHVNGFADVAGNAPNIAGGQVIIGDVAVLNLVFDGNEIQARNGSDATNLYLNDRGGNVFIARGAVGDSSVVLPDDAVSATEILDEPGVASDHTDVADLLSAGTVTAAERTINCPAAGFVVAIATGVFTGPTLGHDSISLGITTSLGSFPSAQKHDHVIEGGSASPHTITIHEVIPVSAGNTTIRFRVSDGQNFASNVRLTLMYFPTTYGPVDIP